MIITNRVVAKGDCLVWCKSRNYAGYGQIRIKGRLWLAHRAVWVEANGPIPDGLFVLHTCDNPPCVNPRHLVQGTQWDNMQDRERKGRGRYGQART